MAKRYTKEYFAKLKADSLRYYDSIPPLNWGKMIDEKYVIDNRYHFDWKIETVKNGKKSLALIDKEVEAYIDEFVEKNKESKVTIFIGTDSQNYMSYTRFVTALVLYVDRNGAHVLISRFDLPKIYDYRYRLLKEFDITMEAVRNLKEFFEEKEIDYELHSDFNESTNHKSNGVVVEAKSYAKHLGHDFKIKPISFAATYAADHFCK